MNLSDKKKDEIFSAISDPIMDLRIDAQKHWYPGSEELDVKLFALQSDIWRAVHKALNLTGPA